MGRAALAPWKIWKPSPYKLWLSPIWMKVDGTSRDGRYLQSGLARTWDLFPMCSASTRSYYKFPLLIPPIFCPYFSCSPVRDPCDKTLAFSHESIKHGAVLGGRAGSTTFCHIGPKPCLVIQLLVMHSSWREMHAAGWFGSRNSVLVFFVHFSYSFFPLSVYTYTD